MRIRHSVSSFFVQSIVPAVCIGMVSYFAWSAFHGPRGLAELDVAQVKLVQRQAELADLRGRRERLAHRVQLLEPGSVDPDLVEEVARTQLMEGAPGQVAVPRSASR